MDAEELNSKRLEMILRRAPAEEINQVTADYLNELNAEKEISGEKDV